MSPSPLSRAGSPIVVAAGLRLPQARAGGRYAGEDAAGLGARAARELLARTGLDPAELAEVIVGCVGPPHDQANVGRVLALRAGVPRQVPAYTVGRNCASGMQAVSEAVTRIEAGRGELFLCVGLELMSAYPLIYNRRATAFFARLAAARTLGARLGVFASFRPAMLAPRIALSEGLTDPTNGLIMGKTAEILAREFAISRETADRYALQSHQRARAARDSGRLAREIVPHLPQGARAGEQPLVHDDGIRDEQSLEALAKLKPYFEKPDGRVTVGNSCGITDGATALVVTTEARARAHGLKPLAIVRSLAWAGCDPARMGLGPVYASAKALAESELRVADLATVEINEAFAAQVLACAKAFASAKFGCDELGRGDALGELDPERLNPNGGAIALGHPVGASGARLILTVAHTLTTSDSPYGLAALCIGGGQGGACVLERCAS
ncbi:MAG: acetyl-CoA C-acyltransferase [Planctomycetes bacterium]|nr:acetyl-CoA C-acyltransferase [Planctomycetota bacterium]